MIFGSIEHLEEDRKRLAAPLLKGLEFLKNNDLAKLELGRHEIDGGNLFALVQEYQTSPKTEKKAEAHRKFIDIQYIVSGTEIIGYGLENPANEVLEDRLAEKDNIFYKSVAGEMELILSAGMYAVLFPYDIHRPGCNYGAGTKVRKIVLKVAVD
ncbi:YhcH/YjgK/YiaL family protein [Hydrogenispora ethanolica]|uniref:YhcH/YjgK/YiaL family protein n=1 Tax=Hydrogenispora ethanolica TaxID=1082276 RepID=A0A4R1RA08_HYDET|nr:YhcH/YjgK/YiaL family protein [Hydrogenispora ethanolica]TCL62449.1 YhcH/YjgK/YiaL family protein [Hydrogenispora ethanolica]